MAATTAGDDLLHRIRVEVTKLKSGNKPPKHILLSDVEYGVIEEYLSDYMRYTGNWPPDRIYGLEIVRESEVVKLS